MWCLAQCHDSAMLLVDTKEAGGGAGGPNALGCWVLAVPLGTVACAGGQQRIPIKGQAASREQGEGDPCNYLEV